MFCHFYAWLDNYWKLIEMYLKVSAPHGARAETLKQIQKHTQALPQSGTNS